MARTNEIRRQQGAGLMIGGWNMFNFGAKTGAVLVCAAVTGVIFSGSTLAQGKELSEKSVKVLMQYAWAITPPKYTSPSGKTIEVDKSKPKDVMVPLEVAREVVQVGYLSAHAQICELAEEQAANYQTLMKRQEAAAKWTSPQLLYIQRLHQVTVMIMTGKIVIVEKEGEKTVVEREAKTNINEKCTDAQRQKVKAQISTYIGAAPPSKTAEPVKAGTQKK